METNTGARAHSTVPAENSRARQAWRSRLSAVHRVPVASLTAANTPRLAGEDTEHATRLAALDEPLPPIVVHQPNMRVIDGVHRLRAAELRGHDHIDVTFFDGTEDDAFVLAVELNRAHGLPLSTADRRAAAGRIVRTHPEWSDRRIARITGIAASTVGSIRACSTDAACSTGAAEQLNIRIGRDGRARPLDSAERRRRAGEFMSAHPNASLREVAKAAGISPATAWDVRARLTRGEDPAAPRRNRKTATASLAPPADTGHLDKPDDAVNAVNALKRDPSLRFTEAGRTLLRFLDCCALDEHEWDAIIQSVPSHQRDTVAKLAKTCAVTWQGVAERLAE